MSAVSRKDPGAGIPGVKFDERQRQPTNIFNFYAGMPHPWYPVGVYRLCQPERQCPIPDALFALSKEELCWLREWSSVKELAIEIEKFVEYFNEQ